MGYSIPNQKENLNLSQYADDTNLFVITEESIAEILNFFKKYEIATGATINIWKTTITPLVNSKYTTLIKKYKTYKLITQKFLLKYLAYTSQMTYKKLALITGNYVNPY